MNTTTATKSRINDPERFQYYAQQFDYERELMDFLLEAESFETFQWSREPDDTEEFWDCEEWEFFDRRSGRRANRILMRLGLTPIPGNDIPPLDEITLLQYAAGDITEGHGTWLIAGGDRLQFREQFRDWLGKNPHQAEKHGW
jgi:hypothetical protein